MGNIFEGIYSIVVNNDAWADGYNFHSQYFVEENTFLITFLLMIGIGIAVALGFYFGLCNGNSNKYATPGNWVIALFVAGIAAFFVSNIYIGSANTNGLSGTETDATGFYKSSELYCQNQIDANDGHPDMQEQVRTAHNELVTKLSQGKDVAMRFNIMNIIISILLFIVTSFVVKNFTKHGSAIPLKLF